MRLLWKNKKGKRTQGGEWPGESEVHIINSVVWVRVSKGSPAGRFQGSEGKSHLVSVGIMFQAQETSRAQKNVKVLLECRMAGEC